MTTETRNPLKFEKIESAEQSARLIEAANALLAEFRAAERFAYDDIHAAEIHYGRWACAGVRYFGDWINPPDAEDDEDYDWQIPTEKTLERANAILARVAARYPDLRLFISVGEKNWLDLQAAKGGDA